VSIVLHLLALRHVGTARQAAYFATAPFLGAVTAVPILGERLSVKEICSGLIMAVGVAVLVRARHAHRHQHHGMEHDHAHQPDPHNRHRHG
jgi:drug/metabolite transporter (DMT)-like permease